MKIGGWILLLISWGMIVGLATFCFKRIFSKKVLK